MHILTCTSLAYSRAPEWTQTTQRYPSSCNSIYLSIYMFISISIYPYIYVSPHVHTPGVLACARMDTDDPAVSQLM